MIILYTQSRFLHPNQNKMSEPANFNDDKDSSPYDNMSEYLEEFKDNIDTFAGIKPDGTGSEEDKKLSEEKKIALSWAYVSLLYLEDDAKSLRRQMRSTFKIKDADIKKWAKEQERIEEETLNKVNQTTVPNPPVSVEPSASTDPPK